MGVDTERVKVLIVTLEAVTSNPHFHRTAFRTPRKAFATLDEAGRDLNLMFDPDHRDFFCEQVLEAFSPVPGGWGRMGATRCDLTVVDEATLLSALTAAHRLAAPKPRVRRHREGS
ncbi:MmcQ/YjbR family DNA-binding protein [Methylorubrum thiocyanatum]